MEKMHSAVGQGKLYWKSIQLIDDWGEVWNEKIFKSNLVVICLLFITFLPYLETD